MKNEIKIQFDDSKKLSKVIQRSYFEDGTLGKLSKKDTLTIPKEDVLYTILKGMNNLTVKVLNAELVDGSMRFIITEKNDKITLSPISIYCIKEGDRYSFY